jgi:hypothetical protein
MYRNYDCLNFSQVWSRDFYAILIVIFNGFGQRSQCSREALQILPSVFPCRTVWEMLHEFLRNLILATQTNSVMEIKHVLKNNQDSFCIICALYVRLLLTIITKIRQSCVLSECKNIKLSLCLTNWALRHEDVWESVCIDTSFLDLCASWRSVVSFTPLSLYPLLPIG